MESQPETSSDAENQFFDLYKYNNKNVKMSQQQRREKFLEEQKQKRHEITDQRRELYEQFIQGIVEEEQMECETVCPQKKYFRRRKCKFELMESEWFRDIPDDLEENWCVKICPQGFRVIIIAKNRTTICYNKHGRYLFRIKSNFPGGNKELNGFTVLDCIFNNPTKSVFVLDCLFWNSMSMLDSEVNFRFPWLKSKFEENPHFTRHGIYNYILLDHMPAQRPLIQDEMFKVLSFADHSLPYDGVVFYHKESHYTFGYTPLVGWLASYMLPEKLHIDVSPSNLVNKPEGYVCMETYLEKRDKIKNQRILEQSQLESEMEIR